MADERRGRGEQGGEVPGDDLDIGQAGGDVGFEGGALVGGEGLEHDVDQRLSAAAVVG
jgi:hypothetical protein